MLDRLRKLVFNIRRRTRAGRFVESFATREPLGAPDGYYAAKVGPKGWLTRWSSWGLKSKK